MFRCQRGGIRSGISATRLRLFLAFCLVLPGVCLADPILPNLFSDHMVVQQGRPIHVWGNAEPGEKLTVTLADKTASAQADAAGQWSVRLPSLNAGGPFLLTVQGKKTVQLKDVMVGEVWIASGQSNMTFALSGSVGADQEIPKADYPNLRLFIVPKRTALEPQPDTLPAKWQVSTSDTVKEFSAVAYYFARDLHRALNVPVGIIESAWPGTAIEEWIDPAALRANPLLKPILDQWDGSPPDVKTTAGSKMPVDLEFDDFELIRDPADGKSATVLSNFEDGTSKLSTGGSWTYNWSEASDTRFSLTAPGRNSSFAARVAGNVDAADDSMLKARFKPDDSPIDLSSYAGFRFWVRGKGSFRVRVLQPTITDWDDYATPLFQATPEWRQVVVLFRDLRQEGWGVSLELTPQSLTGFAIESFSAQGYAVRPVSGLFRGMIVPLLPYCIRGVLWYQGEGNALAAFEYRTLLPAMISSWRKDAGNNFQFLIVQLPNHGAIPTEPTESAWAEMREAQLLTAKRVPGTGIAVTIDVGDRNDLHPHRKAEVGERLALWALGTTYTKPIVYSGPIYRNMEVEGKQIRVHFDHVGGGLQAKGGDLQGFAVAGADHKFHWATASIEENAVIVSSPEVPAPVAVRYAWADSPECNLYNKEGLPASPFRSDDWPGITVKKP